MTSSNPRRPAQRAGNVTTFLVGGCVYVAVLVAVFWF